MKKIATVKEYMENNINGDSLKAMYFVGDLLNGTYVVDVNTDHLDESGSGAWAYGQELIDVCKILEIKTVNIHLLEMMRPLYTFEKKGNDELITDITASIYTADVEHNYKVNAVKGLLASLIDGCTNIEHGAYVYVCSGTAPQSYTGIKNVFDDDSYMDEYEAYWEDAPEETKQLVETLIKWMKGVN